MDRISAANATVDHTFQDGNPGTGQRATSFNAAWANDVQESLMYPIELAGFTPTAGDYAQFFKSLVNLVYFVGMQLVIAGDANPNALYPWQTWDEDTSGRVTVSRDTSQTEFNVVGKIGGDKDMTIPRDGWGAAQVSGHLATPSVSGRLVTGSGLAEDSELLESLAHATADRTVAGGRLPPYVVRRVWVRTA